MSVELPPVLRFRAAVVRRARWVAWLFPALFVVQASITGAIEDFPVALGIFLSLPAFAALHYLDWPVVVARRRGGYALWAMVAWFAAAGALVASHPAMHVLALPTSIGVVALGGIALERLHHWVTTLAVMVLYAVSTVVAERTLAFGEMLSAEAAIAMVSFATAGLRSQFEAEAERSQARAEEIDQSHGRFRRLYAVTTTIAGAESFPELLPKLVATIAHYLDAQIGLVLLHRPGADTLRVMTPIWVADSTLEVGAMEASASGRGTIQEVFSTGRPSRVERVKGEDGDRILGALGIEQALLAPLRVENKTMGVIAVGDPRTGHFGDDQLEALDQLAAPAALVVSQMGRYEAAADMGRRMEEMAQMKSDFVAVVSHELRTPLTSIIGSLDTLSRPDMNLASDPARELLASARRQTTRLRRLIEDLLVVSRIDRGALPVHPERIRLASFLGEILNTVPSLGDLVPWVEPSGLELTIDPDHLGRILINLLENAAKYAAGSPVELRARATDGMVSVRVVDHGPGVPPEQQARVFDRFSQLENAQTRTQGGTGLGLSIVKGLTEAMGGTVRLEDTPGGGATFALEFPASPGWRLSPTA